MQILFYAFLSIFLLINAEKQCTIFPKLADETSVPIQMTEHGNFATPDCDSLNLEPVMDLKCLDGEFYLIDEEGNHKMQASGKDFCIDPDHPLADAGAHTHQRGILQDFWKHVQSTMESATIGCPTEALECFNFDSFAKKYLPGRLDDLDEFFLDLQLDAQAALTYNVYVDEYIREFTFAEGMRGRVIEFKDGMIYAMINTEGEDDFTIYIKPCDIKEGETCLFVIYREKKISGTRVWQEDDITEEMSLDVVEGDQGFRLDMEEIILERLLQNGLNEETGRRYLQGQDNVALTFLYDPTIQTYSNANAHSAEIILEFNDALDEHDDSGFRLLRRALVAVPDNHFNDDHGSCCGSQIADCVSDKNIMQKCRESANSLPPTQMAHLHHCFAHKNSFQGGTIGCGGKNNVGVTTLENGHTTNIAIHEIAHQLGAPHKAHCWCATQIIWCWKTECSIMNPSVSNTVRRFHEETVILMNPAASDHGNTFLPFNPSEKIIPKTSIPDITDTGHGKSHKILIIVGSTMAFIVLTLLVLHHRRKEADRKLRQDLYEKLISPEDDEFTHTNMACTPLTPVQGSDHARQGPTSFLAEATSYNVQVENDNGSDTFSTISDLEIAIEPFVETVTRQYVQPRMGSFSHTFSWDDLERHYEDSRNGENEPINEADRRAWWRFGHNKET